MPYIPQERRMDITVRRHEPTSPGELNYAITTLIDNYLSADPCYLDYNEVIGVLECAKLELYRRLVGPYEEQKMEENGDVYTG